MSESSGFFRQALAYLESLSDEEFLGQLKERCPELFEDPGEPPKDAMLPGRSSSASTFD